MLQQLQKEGTHFKESKWRFREANHFTPNPQILYQSKTEIPETTNQHFLR